MVGYRCKVINVNRRNFFTKGWSNDSMWWSVVAVTPNTTHVNRNTTISGCGSFTFLTYKTWSATETIAFFTSGNIVESESEKDVELGVKTINERWAISLCWGIIYYPQFRGLLIMMHNYMMRNAVASLRLGQLLPELITNHNIVLMELFGILISEQSI